jgi:hypothetical protein
MNECESREARYVPWSFGECFECLTCLHRARQDHRLQPLRGEGYTAVYPFPEHDARDLRCMPCIQGFHHICAGRRICDCSCVSAAAVSVRRPYDPGVETEQ